MENTFFSTTQPTVNSASKKIGLLKTLVITGICLTVFLSALFLFPPKTVQYLTARTTDAILRQISVPAADIETVIVEIDERSLRTHGQWPWPRQLFAELLQNMAQAGASSIGINILFPERDRSSPPIQHEHFGGIDHSPADPSNPPFDHDLVMAKTLAGGPFVLGYEFLFDQHREESIEQCPIPAVSLMRLTGMDDQMPGYSFHQASGVLCNYQPLSRAASSAGFLNGAPDSDGILRRLPLLMQYGTHIYPSFALAVLLRFYNLQQIVIEDNSAPPLRFLLGGRLILSDSQGNILLGPPDPSPPLHLSASDILAKKIDAQQFKEKIVLVGLSAQGLSLGYPTPYSSSATLLDLHASAIRSLSRTLQIVRPPIHAVYESGLSILLCLLLCLFFTYFAMGWAITFCLVTIGTSFFGAQMLLQATGLLFSPLLPSATVVVCGFLFTTLRFRSFQLQAKSERGDALLLLKSSESSLRSILHTVPDIIFRLDAEGKIVFISPAISKYTKSPASLLGQSIFSYVAPPDLDKARFHLNERRTGKRATFDLEIRLLLNEEDSSSEAESRFFSVSAEGLYQNNCTGNPGFIGTQGIVRDITDRKKLEFQLLQAQKMEVIGNLAAGIAHDLNNILSGLVSYPDLLLLEIPKDDPLHNKISIIQKSGQRAAAIVQDLLCMARRNITIAGISNINAIIGEYLESPEYRQLQTLHPNITLAVDLDENLVNINGSTVHLSKVIMNLIHNAMEAMPDGGAVALATKNITLDSGLNGFEHIPAGEYVRLSVTDNGIGIPQSDLQKIFEPFFTRKMTNKSGTGLGMTIIWATVKDHHGYLDIASREGQGTTVNIFLPVAPGSTSLPEQPVVLEEYFGSATILVIDDVAEQLHIATTMLKRLGYTVHAAESGEKAITMVENQNFDLIMCDMIMPGGMDGLETYKKIQEICPRQKAIITSGYSKSERVEEMLKLGAESFVQKPFTMEGIAVAVKAALKTPEAENLPADRMTSNASH